MRISSSVGCWHNCPIDKAIEIAPIALYLLIECLHISFNHSVCLNFVRLSRRLYCQYLLAYGYLLVEQYGVMSLPLRR